MELFQNFIKIILLVSQLALNSSAKELIEKIVSIEGGKIVGETHEDFYAFQGIPYAKSPVGDLRFAPPEAYEEKWEGIREYKNFSERCAQYNHFGYNFVGIEDCLTLNVFAPKTSSNVHERLPVIVFIHGGAFMFGGSIFYGPKFLMQSQNLIVITINYRLGILGFLSTEDEVIPGNFGLKDQVEALRWIQRNIEAFNGDPNKVTITGWSAGGASVHLHYMTPLTDGLFNNGISHSGVAINPWVMMENAREKAHIVAESMKCPTENHQSMLQCLREKPTEKLVLLANKFQPFLYNPFSPFAVVVEPLHKGAFLTDHPLNLLQDGRFKKLPWILSQTQDEGSYPILDPGYEFYKENVFKTLNEKWTEIIPFICDFNETTSDNEKKVEMSASIKNFYLKGENISKENFQGFLDIITDRLYHHGALRAIKLQSNFSPSYFYYFRYLKDDLTKEKLNGNQSLVYGVSHGDDIFLIYNKRSFKGFSCPSSDKIISQQLVSLYQSFATENVAVYDNVEMIKVEPDCINVLEIFSAKNFSITKKNENFGHSKFWDSLKIKE